MADDVISYSGDGTDPDDGALPASAFSWNIDFLHDGHVHPGTPITGVKSGTFTIPDQRARLRRQHPVSHQPYRDRFKTD